jgi:hypothetical protein
MIYDNDRRSQRFRKRSTFVSARFEHTSSATEDNEPAARTSPLRMTSGGAGELLLCAEAVA